MSGRFRREWRRLAQRIVPIVLLALSASPAHAPAASAPPLQDVAIVETSAGSFEIALDRAAAPRTVENFVRLAPRGYFSGSPVLHLLADSLVYLGDPTGTGAGGESIYGRTFPDELAALGVRPYRRGTVAMAHGPARDANTSVFFICAKDADLPPAYTVFGSVLRGMDVVDRIAASEVIASAGRGGRPRRDITILRIAIRTQNGARP